MPDSFELFIFESHEAITGRPRWQEVLDPAQHALKRIVGEYYFPKSLAWPCGLKSCQRVHQKGYVIETEDGYETNIGHMYGKNHFGLVWGQIGLQYKQQREDQNRTAWLNTVIEDRASLLEQIQTLVVNLIACEQKIDGIRDDIAKDEYVSRAFWPAIRGGSVQVHKPASHDVDRASPATL